MFNVFIFFTVFLESCPTDKIETHFCVGEYAMTKEETKDYCSGWRIQPCPFHDILMPSAEAWLFTSALDIWGIPVLGEYKIYGGGGYIANLDINAVV